ncbi:hypothetical protein IW146_007047 [Coemansia sp. RSA 922]|nr:hypothetical protein H4S03_003636 [Coemansia sp. S3946]KAJ2043894.1 hypothetical protein H4S04_006520 [Coemansia sp. S16]KAJ2052550.1 hypothetical protein GGI08_005004 [Coemansia sp. S2]KAJ2072361.1 hypothetical protein GGH13_002735 [Coemansia sp. S155-1]KAJ2108005.1 hypothetical protein IW146_007047 [Coemansia sp. RSA 922]KAJ2344158.1 hypothetical protein GGH92_004606 [Coemansia sp. RSA 2673]
MDQPTNYEPSASATRPQDQAIHLDGPIVLSRAEIFAKQLELNAKRLGFNAKQLDLTDKQLELDEQQRKLDDEQRELNGQSSVSVVFELMAPASARTPAIPVVDAPTDDPTNPTTEKLLAPITATLTELISPCPTTAAMHHLLVAALTAARPTAAQEGKRPAPINESPESPMAPKRHRGDGLMTNDGATTSSSLTTCRSLSEKVAVERLIATLDIPAYFAPATGAPIFGVAPAAGVLDRDISSLVAPAAGAATFGVAPAVGVSDLDISALVAPAAGATTFGNAPAVGFSAVDFSDLVAPAAGATTFGVAPAASVLDRDISALFTPAAGATTFGVASAAGILDRDMRVSNSATAADTLLTVYDVSGEQVTSERLLVVFGASPYVSLEYALDAYSHIYGCELMPRTIPSQYCIATLAKVVALEHWAPQIDEEDFENTADLNILCRRDLERTELRQNYLKQLGLAEDSNTAVLGPRLCYIIVKMCSMSVDLLTGPILRSMFTDATGLDLHALNVVTEKGVQRMEASSICQMVQSCVGNLSKFIADNGVKASLAMARRCNRSYVTSCCDSSSDSTSVAVDMLMNNEHDSKLFLGNQAADLEEPSKRLFFIASRNTSRLTKSYLKQLAMPLQIQPSSS